MSILNSSTCNSWIMKWTLVPCYKDVSEVVTANPNVSIRRSRLTIKGTLYEMKRMYNIWQVTENHSAFPLLHTTVARPSWCRKEQDQHTTDFHHAAKRGSRHSTLYSFSPGWKEKLYHTQYSCKENRYHTQYSCKKNRYHTQYSCKEQRYHTQYRSKEKRYHTQCSC